MFKAKTFTRIFAYLAICSFLFLISPAYSESASTENRGLKIYITRHAETMGNVTGDYSDINQKTFSSKGHMQILGITEKFRDYHFDYIFVSPQYRTQHTILPYLKVYNMVAEIWPEIDEQCFNMDADTQVSETITRGQEIEIISEGKNFFKLRNLSDRFHYSPQTPEECLAQFTRACDLIKKRFDGTKKSILLVCHGCTGSRLMELFLGIHPVGRFEPANAALSLFDQQPDGSFKMILYNDNQFKQEYYWKQKDTGQTDASDQEVVFALFPKYFINSAETEFNLKWQLLNDKGVVIRHGRKKFQVKSREKCEIAQLNIKTEALEYGRIFILESTLSYGNENHMWKKKFMLPTYKNLGGTWLIRKINSPDNMSPDMDNSDWLSTVVPGGWERDALPDYDGIACYRLEFNISDKELQLWSNKKIGIIMGAVDDADITYLNGVKIGELGKFPPEKITAWDKPRIYEVPAELLKQNNILSVFVSDWTGGGGIWKGPVAIGPIEELHITIE